MRERVLWLTVSLGFGLLASAGCEDLRVPDPNVRYIAFGDSSTDGPTDVDYPELLREQLGVPTNAFANEGAGGETTAEGLERLTGLLQGGIYPNATTLLYWEGGGDVVGFLRDADPLLLLSPAFDDYLYADELENVLDSAQADIQAAIETAQASGLTVYVATYPLRPQTLLPCEALPITIMLPGQTVLANEYTMRLNERIRLAAEATGATLVDIEDAVPSAAVDWFDCNHLGPQGNALVAEAFAAAIEPP